MDFQIERKKTILVELERKNAEGTLTQADALDLRQELERCNHIQRHILRGLENVSARYSISAIFATTGFFAWMTLRNVKNTKALHPAGSLLFLPLFIAVPAAMGYSYGGKRFGNKKDAKKYRVMDKDSHETDTKFYEIVNNLKHDNLKHI